MKRYSFLVLLVIHALSTAAMAQSRAYWQQSASYEMEVDVNVETHRVNGSQKLTYTNHSPDTLTHVFYHLYFNAFQPGSMMDVRSRTILDPDGRVRDRILYLSDDEIGYQKILSLSQDGKELSFQVEETVMKVALKSPILPGESSVFEMDFESQIPLQIRRSGRNNREGIDYSMTQWYPKLAEYDENGWHTSPYVGREFYGVWSDFDVKITIDSSYTIGGTGVLQNPEEIGHGYAPKTVSSSTSTLTWHFKAEKVHDFAWAADPDYVHYQTMGPNETIIHILYQPGMRSDVHWEKLGEYTARTLSFFNENYGVYPYPQYTVIQGGDGGMEYPMVTLITGNRSLGSLVGVMAHELAHSWYHGVLGFNESEFPWMDEGFTTFASTNVMEYLFPRGGDPQLRNYYGYLSLKNQGLEEPLTTHADHYTTNRAYGTSSYSMGALFLHQLGYVIGDEVMKRALKRFYNDWKFKHPTAKDFIRIAEKESGIVLDWYLEYWIASTKDVDYGIASVAEKKNELEIVLERKKEGIMPIDVWVMYENGSQEIIHIPLHIMQGAKMAESSIPFSVAPSWKWTHPSYTLSLPKKESDVKKIMVDPTLRMADTQRLNNTYPFPVNRSFMKAAQPTLDSYGYSWRSAAWYGDVSGLHLGFSSYGSYLFDDLSYRGWLMMTSGELNGFNGSTLDVDYQLSFRYSLSRWGRDAYMETELRRFYGIFHNSLTLTKYLGKYGQLESNPIRVDISLFHQQKTAERMIPLYQGWTRDLVMGTRLGIEWGEGKRNGMIVGAQMASAGRQFGANYLTFEANKTKSWFRTFSTRVGFSLGSGSESLPLQFRFTNGGPTMEGAWANQTYAAVSNINASLTEAINLYPYGGNGLIGYQIDGIGSPDLAGNNFFSAWVWNYWTPFTSPKLRPTTFELFSGIGQTWDGDFMGEMPMIGDDEIRNYPMASFGVGLSYAVSQLRSLRRWTPQSTFLQDLELSIRVPMYLHQLSGRSNWGPWLMFGVSNNF